MTGLWIGLGMLVGATGVALLVARGFAVQNVTPPMPERPDWGCGGCQDQADEIAELEAIWRSS